MRVLTSETEVRRIIFNVAELEMEAYERTGEPQRLAQAEVHLIDAEKRGARTYHLRQRLSSYGYGGLNSTLVEC